ncbi:MAG: ribosomal-processing cysteine protease Prp [Mycoplasmatota bacterium]|nr:ribosomal-processing cysteine protease Prp [Mycoplasmatota bacterium]
MIKVKVETKNSHYIKISILGHAMYDDYGKDIVCSAASSIAITTINGILTLNKDSLSYQVTKEGLIISKIDSNEVTQKLLGNMVNLLKELECKYPTNIEVK